MIYVVRSDLCGWPTWLTCTQFVRRSDPWRHEPTNCHSFAAQFKDPTEAQKVADQWSDFPGVWRVVVRAGSGDMP